MSSEDGITVRQCLQITSATKSAHLVTSRQRGISVAFGGEADVAGRAAAGILVATDPTRTSS
jgi:hypothetical protein